MERLEVMIKWWTELPLNLSKNEYGISTRYSHLDSTSFHLHGQYNNRNNYETEEERLEVTRENPIFITEGYSRDHRPDLKQCVLDLIVSSDGDIPIFIRGGSGNESDKAMFGKILAEYSQQIDFEVTCELVGNKEQIDEAKNQAGRFILATNILSETEVSSAEILTAYKKQQSCERGFRFLKDPLFFTDSLYIKNPERIETMMMLMGLSLLVYTVGQREIRNNLEARKSFVKNQVNKLIQRPTLRWIFQCFQGIHCFKLEGVERISNLSEERCRILKFLPIACQKYYLLT